MARMAAVPPGASAAIGLATLHLTSDESFALVIVVIGGMFALLAVAIIEIGKTRRSTTPERERTRREELARHAVNTVADAEGDDRRRYAKAQTRPFFRLKSGEKYKPDEATDLVKLIHESQKQPDESVQSQPPPGRSAQDNGHPPEAVIVSPGPRDRRRQRARVDNGGDQEESPVAHGE